MWIQPRLFSRRFYSKMVIRQRLLVSGICVVNPKDLIIIKSCGIKAHIIIRSLKSKDTNGKYVRREGYATTLTTDYAIDFLEHRNTSMPFCLLVHHKAPHRNWMPEPKYLHLYENAEFPYPDTFDDDYNTRCRPANEQEMQIDKDMTIVYDLKLNQLKDTSPYNKEWNVKGCRRLSIE